MYTIVLIFIVTVWGCNGIPQYHRRNVDDSKTATILQHENNNIGVGNYNFAFESSDGTVREEKAEFKNLGGKDQSMVVYGSYQYIGDDGITYTVTYVADENGYRATGEHIPKN